jgi:hypothetical protein
VRACGYVPLCLTLNGTASGGPGSSGAYPVPKKPRVWLPGPECVLSWAMRRSYNGLTGGEILLAHGHQDGRKDQCRSGLSLDLFRLVVPAFHLGVVVPYLARGE